jgi:hypothetical protein
MCVTLFLQSVQQEFTIANAFNSSVCLQALLTQKKGLFNEANFNLRRNVNSKNNKQRSTENRAALHGTLDTIGSAVTFQILIDPLF